MTAVAYLSAQCPNCERLHGILERLQLRIKIVYVDDKQIPGLRAVPTIVDSNRVSHVGTKAFEWLQAFEAEVPLEAYATVSHGDVGYSAYS